MTTGGDAVLAVARGEVGYVEGPNNSTKYWDWWGYNLGPWCGVFVSWCYAHAGYPHCDVDGQDGFVLCSNGVLHSYSTTPEAKPTVELEPGDTVLFSWYSWEWQGGLPIITEYPYVGYVAGDHTGIFAYWIDQSAGHFACVEGNTSSSSYDNGGMVLERTDRYTSQVCGWWRPPTISNELPQQPQPSSDLLGLGVFLLQNDRRGIWLMGPGYAYGLNEEEYSQLKLLPGIQTYWCGNNERAFDLFYQSCMNGATAVEN